MAIRTLLAALVTLAVAIVVVWHARRSALLKDRLIPQIPPHRQTFSFARTQMAFWFVVVLFSFVYLAVDRDSSHVMSSQGLILMGIAAVTAGGGIAIDLMRDTAEDSLNDGLRLLGLASYQDIVRLKAEIDAMEAQGTALTPAGRAALNDRRLLFQVYQERTSSFETRGWFSDLTTDIDGVALHRLQAVIWTAVGGGIFIIQVVASSAMPHLDENLLLLTAISSAGYLGLKVAEIQY